MSLSSTHAHYLKETIFKLTQLTFVKKKKLQKMEMTQACRPLKCKLCWRRFKYVACLKDHLHTDHYATLMIFLQLRAAKNQVAKQRALLNNGGKMEQKKEPQSCKQMEQACKQLEECDQMKVEPVRVSVIRRNTIR
jgi:hypothetical protein